jgi:hypothetical protein
MPVVSHKHAASRRRSHPTTRPDTTDIASGDASPCPNPSCRAPGWPLVAKPRNWPWAEHCWNCGLELR